jgi:flagellar hook-length control protein FliK
MADYLKTSQRQLSLEVVSQKEARDRAIQRAVDKMQSDFFTQPQAVPQQQPGIAADKYKQVQSSGPEKNAAPVTRFMANAMPNRGGFEASAQMAPMMMNQVPQEGSGSQNDGSAGQFQELSGTVGQSSNKMTAAATLAAGAATVALPEEQTSIPAEMTESNELGEAAPDLFDMQMDPNFATLDIPDAEVVSVNTTGSSAGSSAPAAATVVNPMASAGESSMGGRDDNGGSEEQSADSFNQPVNNIGAGKQQTVNGLKNESFIVNTQPTPIQEAQNIKEVISRAQMLATKGGGEMKIVMNPEALGEVTMKVAVQNGQVNVEMIAESREAKKLLETGLGDLKATLLSNNLKVDQIKVETPADIGRQLTQNHDEAQRQFAQQFMEQFRQENNEWRRGFYDIGGAKPYRGQKEEAERGPNVNNSSDRRRESRRLDLVA